MRVRNRLLVALPLLVNACVLSGGPVSPYGRSATVYPVAPAAVSKVRGELMAASADTVWLLRDSTLVPFASSRLHGVEVQRHEFGAKRTMKWMSIAGLVTGVALMVSCSSYESSPDGGGDSGGCVAVLPGTLLFFAATGGIFAFFNDYSSKQRILPGGTVRLRPYARFPQGIPDSLRRLQFVPSARP